MQRVTSIFRTATMVSSVFPKFNLMPAFFSTMQKIVNRENLLEAKTPMLTGICGFKLKGRVRRRCKSCYFVVRDGRMHIICPEHPRHKQMAMRPKPHNTWILTHASQSRVRPW